MQNIHPIEMSKMLTLWLWNTYLVRKNVSRYQSGKMIMCIKQVNKLLSEAKTLGRGIVAEMPHRVIY